MVLSWIFFSLSKFRGTSVLWEKAFFCIFAWPHRENFQKIYNRTILKFDALRIAHIEADVPLFSKHLWKLAIRLKLWVLAHSEVSWSRTMTAKMSVFRPLFWRKSLFWPILTQWTPPSVTRLLTSILKCVITGRSKKSWCFCRLSQEICSIEDLKVVASHWRWETPQTSPREGNCWRSMGSTC